MSARMSLLDLSVDLIFLEYKVESLEELHYLLDKEFPEEQFTLEEVYKWQEFVRECKDLEFQLNECYYDRTTD